MVLYIDTSALIKNYIGEKSSTEVNHLINQSEVVGSVKIAQVELSAAINRMRRDGRITEESQNIALNRFMSDWKDAFSIIRIENPLIEYATQLTCRNQLRGYDAVHLAAALTWQNSFPDPIMLATYDKELWIAARDNGLTPWPAGYC